MKKYFPLFILFFSFFNANFFYAQKVVLNKKALTLKEIDYLIDRQEYNSALKELSLYIQQNPEDFDNAQKRIYICLEERDYFNLKANELAEKILIDETSENLTDRQKNSLEDQKLRLIVQLEKSERNPFKEAKDLTNDARRTVKLSYYINKASSISKSAQNYLREADYFSANEFYLSAKKSFEAIDLKNSDSDIVFDNGKELIVEYPEELKESVKNEISTIEKFLPSIKVQLENCQKSYEEYLSLIQQRDFDLAKESLSTLENNFSILCDTRNIIFSAGKNLEKLEKFSLDLFPLLKETSYITFPRQAVCGFKNQKYSGIVGTLDCFIISRIESLKNQIIISMNGEFSSLENLFGDEKILSSQKTFSFENWEIVAQKRNSLINACEQAKKLHQFYNFLEENPAKNFTHFVSSIDSFENFVKSPLRSLFNIAKNIGRKIDNFKSEDLSFQSQKNDSAILSFCEFYEKQTVLLNELNKNELLTSNFNSTSPIQTQNFYAQTSPFKTELNDENIFWDSESEFFWNLEELCLNECALQTKSMGFLLSKNYAVYAKNKQNELLNDFKEIQSFAGGIEENVEGIKIVKYFPTKAFENSLQLNEKIENEKQKISSFKETLQNSFKIEEKNSDFEKNILTIEEVISSLNGLSVNITQIASNAKIMANDAKRASNESRLKFSQAENLLKQKKYDEARIALNSADEKYKLSLSLEENENLRNNFASKIAALDEKITFEQNAFVISEVRSKITQSYNEYYAGNFEIAKNNLLEAKKSWEKTQSIENNEIETLLSLVNSALESSGGKQILFSDPLYREMGTYLNNASLYYYKGVSLIEENKTEEGYKLLNQSREEVRKVQRVFPKNQDANNLTLLLNKILDRELYNSSVDEKIQKALINADSEKEIDLKTSLSELKELQKIIPEETKVLNAIKNLENKAARLEESNQIKKDRAESERLTNLSQKEKNTSKKIELLDRAIFLNRNNLKAQKLKDEILLKESKNTIVKNHISDADELKYKQAELYYNDKDKVNASLIINELAERNPQVLKIKKLKQRIDNL